MKKIISLMMMLMLVFAFTACGGGNQESGEPDSQNPVMNYVGPYVCQRAVVTISAEGKNGASAFITWGGSATSNAVWQMSGTFDSEKLQFEYSNGVKTAYEYNDKGEVVSEEEIYNDGEGDMTFTDGEELSLTWADKKENAADGMVFTFDANATGMTEIANPWHTVDSLAEAAEGAGVEVLTIPEGTEISLGAVSVGTCRYMEGLAEVEVPYPAVGMTIRKGTAAIAGPEGDLSGDYNEYSLNWTQEINDIKVNCFGNRKGEATKTIWTAGDYSYSITAYGLGGDTDFGLKADDLTALISGLQ